MIKYWWQDSKEFSQIHNTRELDMSHIQEQEQELQDNHNKLPPSSQFKVRVVMS